MSQAERKTRAVDPLNAGLALIAKALGYGVEYLAKNPPVPTAFTVSRNPVKAIPLTAESLAAEIERLRERERRLVEFVEDIARTPDNVDADHWDRRGPGLPDEARDLLANHVTDVILLFGLGDSDDGAPPDSEAPADITEEPL